MESTLKTTEHSKFPAKAPERKGHEVQLAKELCDSLGCKDPRASRIRAIGVGLC